MKIGRILLVAVTIAFLLALAVHALAADQKITWTIVSCDLKPSGTCFTIGLQPSNDDSFTKTFFYADGFQQLIALMGHFKVAIPQDLVGQKIEGDPIDGIVAVLKAAKLESIYEKVLDVTANGFSKMMLANFAGFYNRVSDIAVLERVYAIESRGIGGRVSDPWLSHLNAKVQEKSSGKVRVLQGDPKDFKGLKRNSFGDPDEESCIEVISADGPRNRLIIMKSDPFFREGSETESRPIGYHYHG